MDLDRWALGAVVGAYLALGVAYACRTPIWQVPDEPAHYNYIAQLARDPFDPPELTAGDWSQADLERLTRHRFAPELSVEHLSYEDYQPPLYYYLALVPFRLAGPAVGDRVRAVRLFGVLLGAATVLLAWGCVRLAWPEDPVLATAVAAFVACLPMHLAMNAAVNNDPLAFALVAGALCLALARAAGRLARRRFAWSAGVLAWLVLLTKLSAYPALAVLVAAEALAWRRAGGRWGLGAAWRLVQPLAVAVVLALPWWLRNAARYGASDWFGTMAHDRIVVGQARTAAWVARHGLDGLIERLVTFTFASFWGVFGWMGVFLDRRIYLVLAVLSLVALLGLLRYLVGLRRATDPAAPTTRAALGLMGLLLGLTVAVYLAYNLRFVQHQGRYLFPALIPIATGFLVGLRQLGGEVADRLVPARHRRAVERLVLYGCGAALAALAWLSLVRYIVPGLS